MTGRSFAFTSSLSGLLFLCTAAAAQTASGDFWSASTARSSAPRGSQEARLQLDQEALKRYLGGLPKADGLGTLPLALPGPDGVRRNFEVSRSLVMSPELAAKFPELQTFQGLASDGSGARVRFETGPNGFSAMLFGGKGVSLIERDQQSGEFVSYAREGRRAGEPFQCGVHTDAQQGAGEAFAHSLSANANTPKLTGPTLRTYRTAVAATGEYTATFGGTVALGLGGVVSAVNRINQIYETDLALRLVLVANNHLLIYTDALNDPYTNSNGSTMLGQNQTNLTTVIGAANYDFGHVFSTGGGGVASLNSVCNAGLKARGVTGRGTPNNDPFWVDYVAHEMGHQLNAPHTFNATTGNCAGGNRSPAAAYEVGSGSTIMAYAGICGAEDLQPNSDPFFHVASLNTIHTYSQTGTGASCGLTSATGNSAPVITPLISYTIPAQTAFALTASASDPNGDPLTYLWEQFNLDPIGSDATTVNQDNGIRPLFRSFEASSSPTRLFPRLQNILLNSQSLGEVLPTTNRNLTFRVTARDNRAGGGGVDWATVSLTTVNTGSAFAVTSPNSASSWSAASTQTVTWNVAGTNANNISCANVDLAWSTDGGQSFAAALLSGTANDGTESITVPAQATSAGRVRVSCSNNIFFDINDADVTVTGGNAAPVLTLPGGAVSYTSNGPAVLLDTLATVSDSDSADFAGGRLSVSIVNNSEGNDRLEIRNEGAAAGQISVVGDVVSFGGVAIGTVTGGVGVRPLELAFNSSSSPAAAQAVLRNVRYRALSGVAGTLPRTVQAALTDGDGGSAVVATKLINIALNANAVLAFIEDNDSDNLLPINLAANYVVVFTKDIDLATVSAADFDNAGTSTFSIGEISEPTPGVLNIAVIPRTAGTLILRIPSEATILDAGGVPLIVPAQDNDVLNVDGTLPTISSIDDGDADNTVLPNETLNYTLTFSEEVTLASISATDFDNAGSATVLIGAIARPSPNVVTVAVTPTRVGTLILRIPAGAVISDVAGNAVATPVQDGDTVTVTIPGLIFADSFE